MVVSVCDPGDEKQLFIKGSKCLLNMTKMSPGLIIFQSLCYTNQRMAEQPRLKGALK